MEGGPAVLFWEGRRDCDVPVSLDDEYSVVDAMAADKRIADSVDLSSSM